MTPENILLSILEVAVIMPLGIMCLLTFKKDLKLKHSILCAIYTGVFAALAAVGGISRLYFTLNINFVVIPYSALLLMFLLLSVKENKLNILYLFASAGAVITSLRLYGYLLEASIDSSKNFSDTQSWGLLLRWGLTAVFFLVFTALLPKVRWLMNCASINRIWKVMWLVPFTFAASNIIMIPYDYYFMDMGRVAQIYVTVTTVLLIMHIIFQLMLYYIAKTLTEKAKADEESRMLSVQASQYENLQRHIEATSKLRHDFKHMARTAVALAKNGDSDAMINLLTDYGIEIEAAHTQTVFTKNSAVNALICYYYENARQAGISCNWQVALPEKLNVPDIDLCTVIGNLLENAIYAAKDAEDIHRYINFKADTEDNGDIYIVTTNGFAGKIKKDKDRYLSTKEKGSGIGIESIKTAVTRHNGFVSFYNDQNTFYADIMIKQR